MIVVAGLAYDVVADNEELAETILLNYLSDNMRISHPGPAGACHILKIWVSARQNDKERVQDLQQKERDALQ
jgi:hypothetical protein